MAITPPCAKIGYAVKKPAQSWVLSSMYSDERSKSNSTLFNLSSLTRRIRLGTLTLIRGKGKSGRMITSSQAVRPRRAEFLDLLSTTNSYVHGNEVIAGWFRGHLWHVIMLSRLYLRSALSLRQQLKVYPRIREIPATFVADRTRLPFSHDHMRRRMRMQRLPRSRRPLNLPNR